MSELQSLIAAAEAVASVMWDRDPSPEAWFDRLTNNFAGETGTVHPSVTDDNWYTVQVVEYHDSRDAWRHAKFLALREAVASAKQVECSREVQNLIAASESISVFMHDGSDTKAWHSRLEEEYFRATGLRHPQPIDTDRADRKRAFDEWYRINQDKAMAAMRVAIADAKAADGRSVV